MVHRYFSIRLTANAGLHQESARAGRYRRHLGCHLTMRDVSISL
ncbi:hypothetical protein G155_00121 [Mycobacterium sp. VKM Ac-1817D]|nr:hypothetical protein G155_00121 [Mycobacterium sp. VKM Ac-1817D]